MSYHGKNATAFYHLTGGAADGIAGYVEFAKIRSWTYTLTATTADATGMSANGRSKVAGLASGTASIECVYDSASLVQLDESDNNVYVQNSTGIQIQLLRDGTDASKGLLSGAVMTGGPALGQGIDGTPTITYNFILTGTPTGSVTAGS